MFESISGLFKNISGWMIGRSLGEIFLIFMVVYVVLRIMQGTSGTSILRGLAFIIVLISIGVLFFVRKLQLFTIDWLITEFVPVFIIPIIILFQPEFRRALLRLGQNPVFSMFLKSEQQEMTYEIIQAVEYLSKNRIGALIAIERDIGLGNFVETGTKLHADVSRDLLNTIFWPGSPLHDGAVIIQEQKISAAGCLLPLTEKTELSRSLGTRHRAASVLPKKPMPLSLLYLKKQGLYQPALKGH